MELQERYNKEILPKLKEKFGIKNNLAVPRIKKVSINIGFGKHSKEKDFVKLVESNLNQISGQQCILTRAKKAISAFKVREDMIIGATVNLRGKRMYDFINKLINVYFPRVRDFRGISDKGVDRNGNITIGFKDVAAFAEIEVLDLDKIHGLEISIATTAKNREEGLELFKLMNFPFKK